MNLPGDSVRPVTAWAWIAFIAARHSYIIIIIITSYSGGDRLRWTVINVQAARHNNNI